MKDSSNVQKLQKPQKCLLIVDHDHDVLLFLKDRLIAMGYEVVTATNGQEGLDVLQRQSIDGILLELPVMGGFYLLEQLKQHFPSLPIIVMSANDHRSEFRKALRKGAADYLIKPIAPNELTSKCEKVFG